MLHVQGRIRQGQCPTPSAVILDSRSIKTTGRVRHGAAALRKSAAEADQALGRSRGGLTTKRHLACDGRGRPAGMLSPPASGRRAPQLEPPLDAIRCPGRPRGGRANAPRTWLPTADEVAADRHAVPERSDQHQAGTQRGARGDRPPKLDPEAYASATWSSAVSPGSSSTAASRQVRQAGRQLPHVAGPGRPSRSDSQHEPSARPWTVTDPG
jgi:hypothetical protein